MVATPTATPIPIAILSDVFKPPEDVLPLSLEIDVARDEADAVVAILLDADASKETPTPAHASCAHPMKDCRSV